MRRAKKSRAHRHGRNRSLLFEMADERIAQCACQLLLEVGIASFSMSSDEVMKPSSSKTLGAWVKLRTCSGNSS